MSLLCAVQLNYEEKLLHMASIDDNNTVPVIPEHRNNCVLFEEVNYFSIIICLVAAKWHGIGIQIIY